MMNLFENLQLMKETTKTDQNNVLYILKFIETFINNSHDNNYTASISDNKTTIEYGYVNSSNNPYYLTIEPEKVVKYKVYDGGDIAYEDDDIEKVKEFAAELAIKKLKENN